MVGGIEVMTNFALAYQITRAAGQPRNEYARTAANLLYYYITQARGPDYAPGVSRIFFDAGLDARFYCYNIGLSYDWVYDQLAANLSSAQLEEMLRVMNEWMNWMNYPESQMLYQNMTYPQYAQSLGFTPPTVYGQRDPDTNYCYNFLVGTASLAYATYGDTWGSTTSIGSRFIDENSRPEQVQNVFLNDIVPFLNGQVTAQSQCGPFNPGGNWSEGLSYGDESLRAMIRAIKIMQSADDDNINYFGQSPYFQTMPLFWIHGSMPDATNITNQLGHIYGEGDWARNPQNLIYPDRKSVV